MQNFLDSMTSLFRFLLDQITAVANFFTSSTLGMIILGISLFGVVFKFISYVIDKTHK